MQLPEVLWICVIFTHIEVIKARPGTLWQLFVAAGGLFKSTKGEGAPKLGVLRSRPGTCSVEIRRLFSGSVLIVGIGDRRVSQGDGMDNNNEERRNVGGGETAAAEIVRGLVVVSRAGIFLPNLQRKSQDQGKNVRH